MTKAELLKIDDPNWSAYSTDTYYGVPDYVWNALGSRLRRSTHSPAE